MRKKIPFLAGLFAKSFPADIQLRAGVRAFFYKEPTSAAESTQNCVRCFYERRQHHTRPTQGIKLSPMNAMKAAPTNALGARLSLFFAQRSSLSWMSVCIRLSMLV
jgi:hypothetical protein